MDPGTRPEDPRPPEDDLPASEDLVAVEQEERIVGEAAARPADGAGPRAQGPADRAFLYAVVTLAVLLFLGWMGGTTLWQLRRDLEALEGRLASLRQEVGRAEARQAVLAAERARAEIRVLREGLSGDLRSEAERAEQILERLSEGLDAPSR